MILRVFLIAGARIGVLGSLAGLVLGIVFAMNIEAVRQFIMWVTGATLFDPNIYFLSRMTAENFYAKLLAIGSISRRCRHARRARKPGGDRRCLR